MLHLFFVLALLVGTSRARLLCDLGEDDGLRCECSDFRAVCEPTKPLVRLIPSAAPSENAKRRREARMINEVLLLSPTNESFLQTIPRDIFQEPNHIKNLTIIHANLTTLWPRSVHGSKYLQELILQQCGITDLKRKAIVGLMNLAKLDLSFNKISFLSSGVFSLLPILKELYLEDSEIREIGAHAFVELRQLEILSIKGNELKYLDNLMFSGLRNLKHLDARTNVISKIDENTFQDLPELNHVDLSGNGLVTISPKLFRGLNRLEYLNLFFNSLRQLPDSFLFESKQLKELHLERNQLETVTLEMFDGLKVIRPDFQLFLQPNRLNCSCDLYFLRELEKRRMTGSTDEFKTPKEFENLQCQEYLGGNFVPKPIDEAVFNSRNCQEHPRLAEHIVPQQLSSTSSPPSSSSNTVILLSVFLVACLAIATVVLIRRRK